MAKIDLPPTAPIDSASHQRLLSLAKQAGMDVELVRDLLWLIVAHDHLIALPKAAAMMRDILDLAPTSWENALNDAGLPAFRPILEWLINQQKSLTQHIGPHYGRTTNTAFGNPIMGSGASHLPMYATLCETPPQEIYRTPYIMLVGHLLLAHMVSMREYSDRSHYETMDEWSTWKPLPNAVNTAALAIRRLTEDRYQSHVMQLETDLEPKIFANFLPEISFPFSAVLDNDHRNLYRFLQKSWAIRKWAPRDGSRTGNGSGGHRWVGGRLIIASKISIETQNIGDADDPYDDWGALDRVVIRDILPSKQKQHLQSDLSPDEDEGNIDIVLSNFNCTETKKDPGSLARTARGKARYLTNKNQLLPWDYEGLALEEIARLVSQIRWRFKHLSSIKSLNPDETIELEVMMLIHTMLWTGSDVARATHCIVELEDTNPAPYDMSLVISSEAVERMRWRIRALSPEYRSTIIETPKQLRQLREQIDLPDMIGLTPFVRAMLADRSIGRDTPVFLTPLNSLQDALRSWLIKYVPGDRITISKIANTLWRHLHQELGDITLACAALGIAHPLARTRLFYTTPSVAILQDAYQRVVRKITDYTYTALGKLPTKSITPWLPLNASKDAVGARMCPSVAAVRHYFEQLKRDINIAMDYRNQADFIHYHNLYTLYSIQQFAYSTTCRAIVTPYLTPASILIERSIATLSDKDDESHHKTRLIWLPDPLQDQMQRYAAHLEVLKAQLFYIHPSLRNEPCLFLTTKMTPTLVRPKVIEPLIKPYLNVAANTHRRILRTELVERHCPHEIVDAFMGHWQNGEEPFGIFSSFSFADYVTTLKKYLEPLLHEMGIMHSINSRLKP
jgi:hypothetical protein